MSIRPVPAEPIRLGKPASDASTPDGMHPCRITRDRDVFAVGGIEQYTIGCECHDRSRQIWRPGDVPYRCPVTGAWLQQ